MQMTALFLRSKVARRIVLLFCSCALLPVTILAVVCYRQVASQLREQSHGHLLRSTKEEGMAVYARLGMIDSELQVLASRKGTESFASLGPDVRAMLRPAYLAESWTVVQSQERAQTLASMQRFRRSFPLVVLLSLWIYRSSA